jgi:hypothetical protein
MSVCYIHSDVDAERCRTSLHEKSPVTLFTVDSMGRVVWISGVVQSIDRALGGRWRVEMELATVASTGRARKARQRSRSPRRVADQVLRWGPRPHRQRAAVGRHRSSRIGSEIAQGYKPQPKVYLATCEAFNLEPAQVMMCAAHSGDLAAAQALGLKTGHIGRPGEGGPGTGETEPKGSFDVVGRNFHDFADKLGV